MKLRRWRQGLVHRAMTLDARARRRMPVRTIVGASLALFMWSPMVSVEIMAQRPSYGAGILGPAPTESAPPPQDVSGWAGDYFTDTRSRCKLWWPGRAVVSVRWNGSCSKGLAQGRGVFEVVEKFSDAEQKPYMVTSTGEGEFADGKLSGRGFYAASNGYRTEGEFSNGLLNGKGIRSGKDRGRSYHFEAAFVGGVPNGWGVKLDQNTEDGKTYWTRTEGNFLGEELQGRGVRVEGRTGCKPEQRYEGEWKGNSYHGRGTLTTYSGKKYSGTWEKGVLGNQSRMDLEESTEKLDVLCGDPPPPPRQRLLYGHGLPGR